MRHWIATRVTVHGWARRGLAGGLLALALAVPAGCGGSNPVVVDDAGMSSCPGGSMPDVDECAEGTPCGPAAGARCTDAPCGYTCTCPAGHFAPASRGTCEVDDATLTTLVPSIGTLAPTFEPGTPNYTLEVPAGTTGVTFTPTAADPTRTTILIDGMVVASGTASQSISSAGWRTVRVTVEVTTETGATSTYRVDMTRHPMYAKASNTGANDQFGQRVALSADGSTLAVGAPAEASSATGVNGDQTDDTAPRAGAVYVFRAVAGGWLQEAYIKASNTDAGDQFGTALALSSDGSLLAVSAPWEASLATGVGGEQADNSSARVGAVYVFGRGDGGWSQEAYIKASDAHEHGFFGDLVALNTSGTMLAVSSGGLATVGACYIFAKSGGVWSEEARFTASNTEPYDEFGSGLALSADGTTLAIGARGEASRATGVGGDSADNSANTAGAVYVFGRDGGMWSETAYIKASNTDSGDEFGASVALAADGSTLAVGAVSESSAATGVDGDQADNSGLFVGAVYVFTRSGADWSQQAYVKAPNASPGDTFGSGVALSGDGSTLVVGALGEASSATGLGGDLADDSARGAGAAYVYTRDGAIWSHQVYVKATNTGQRDGFGIDVSMSGNGTTLVCSAFREGSSATGIDGDQADDSAPMSGAVYVY